MQIALPRNHRDMDRALVPARDVLVGDIIQLPVSHKVFRIVESQDYDGTERLSFHDSTGFCIIGCPESMALDVWRGRRT